MLKLHHFSLLHCTFPGLQMPWTLRSVSCTGHWALLRSLAFRQLTAGYRHQSVKINII